MRRESVVTEKSDDQRRNRCQWAAALVVQLIFWPMAAWAAEYGAGAVTDERVLAEAPTGQNWLVKGGGFAQLRIPVDRDRAFRFNVTEDSEFA